MYNSKFKLCWPKLQMFMNLFIVFLCFVAFTEWLNIIFSVGREQSCLQRMGMKLIQCSLTEEVSQQSLAMEMFW